MKSYDPIVNVAKKSGTMTKYTLSKLTVGYNYKNISRTALAKPHGQKYCQQYFFQKNMLSIRIKCKLTYKKEQFFNA